MELWVVALIAIVGMAAVGTVVARHPAGPPRSLRALIAARVLAVVIVTAIVALVRIEIGPPAAAATGIVGVGVTIGVLIRTGYAGSLFASR